MINSMKNFDNKLQKNPHSCFHRLLWAALLTGSLVASSAQRVGFFNIGSDKIPGSGSGSGRSVEIYDRVFPGILFTLGYF